MDKYDILIVGAGPCGYFCAYELINKEPNLKICIIDKGNQLSKRYCPVMQHKLAKCPNGGCKPACSIMNGFGGAGAYSDGKFIISKEYGGWLQDYIGEDKTLDLIKYVDDINLSYGATTMITDPTSDKAHELEKRALGAGLKLLKSQVRHLGTDENIKILSKIYSDLQRQVEFKFATEVSDLLIKDNTIYGVIANDTEILANRVILAVGRDGSSWMSKLLSHHGIKMTQNQVDIGVRVECPNLVMEEINDSLYEGKLVYSSNAGLPVRTFCSNPGGQVVVENYADVINVNGHAYSDYKLRSNNTNFALLATHTFTEPFNEPNEYAKKISSLANQLACGGVIVQRFGDLIHNRRTTEKRLKDGFVKPTLKEAVPGDLSLCLPEKTLRSIIEMIYALDKLTPGIASDHTLLYGIEAKYYSAHPDVIDGFEVDGIKNLFVGGDGAGLTRGLAQAGACGVYIARNILSKGN